MKHGTIYCYQQGCRQEECRAAQVQAVRAWRTHRRAPRYAEGGPLGPEARKAITALCFGGSNPEEAARLVGISRQMLTTASRDLPEWASELGLDTDHTTV